MPLCIFNFLKAIKCVEVKAAGMLILFIHPVKQCQNTAQSALSLKASEVKDL